MSPDVNVDVNVNDSGSRAAVAGAATPRRSGRAPRIVYVCVYVYVYAFNLAGCGPKPKPDWVEHELGTSHAGGSSPSGSGSSSAPVLLPIDLAKLDPLTIDELDLATAKSVIDQLGDAKPAARVALRAARLAAHQGDEAEARALLARAATAADEAEVHAELAKVAKLVAASPVDPKIVAVLLPLSGKYSAIGSELKLAIQLAPAEGTSWLFLDTRGEPDKAAAAVETAVSKGAVAILGPVGVRETLAAARAAALHDIPIGLLAPADGADPASGVFRLVGSPADEGRAVARLAQADHFPTVGVFAPRDDVGQETAEAFIDEARKLGIRVTAQATYDPTGGKLEPDVKELLNLVPARNPRLAEHLAKNPKNGWKTFSPDVPFTLLYVPDRYDRAALVAAFLPYLGVELRTGESTDPAYLQRKHHGHMPQLVQLVGGAGWHHPSLPTRGGAAIQGALIVDVFGGGTFGGDQTLAFAEAFQQKSNRAPSGAAAEAYDAAMLVAQARAASAHAADPRAALRTALARGKLDDGACGPAAMDETGEIARTPVVLEVQGDELVEAP